MNALITDEIVEKAARAAFDKFAESDAAMLHLWDSSAFDREEWIEQTRASLHAILPDVLEECAKAMEGLPHMFDAPSSLMEAQNAIRLLKGNGK